MFRVASSYGSGFQGLVVALILFPPNMVVELLQFSTYVFMAFVPASSHIFGS